MMKPVGNNVSIFLSRSENEIAHFVYAFTIKNGKYNLDRYFKGSKEECQLWCDMRGYYVIKHQQLLDLYRFKNPTTQTKTNVQR